MHGRVCSPRSVKETILPEDTMGNDEGRNKWSMIHLAGSIATVLGFLVTFFPPAVALVKEYLGYPISTVLPLAFACLFGWGVYRLFQFLTSLKQAVAKLQETASNALSRIEAETIERKNQERFVKEEIIKSLLATANDLQTKIDQANKVRAAQDQDLSNALNHLDSELRTLSDHLDASQAEKVTSSAPGPISAKLLAASKQNDTDPYLLGFEGVPDLTKLSDVELDLFASQNEPGSFKHRQAEREIKRRTSDL